LNVTLHPDNDITTKIENVTSVSCSNQTASGMTVTVTSQLTNLSEGSSGVKMKKGFKA